MTKQLIKPCEFVSGACIHCEATEREKCEGWVCPPQRQWVGLTDEEMNDPRTQNFDFIYGARWAETKLKERNG